MRFEKTHIKDLVIIHHDIHTDDRGYFIEDYNQKTFIEYGINATFVQDNRSFSKYGTLRGLHYQTGEFAQSKLMRVLAGKVLDVAVDIRKDSPTFGDHFAIELQENDGISFFVPRGFAHGFVVLSKTAMLSYKCDNFYSKNHEGGIFYNDDNLKIDWKLKPEEIVLSDKDQKWSLLKNLFA